MRLLIRREAVEQPGAALAFPIRPNRSNASDAPNSTRWPRRIDPPRAIAVSGHCGAFRDVLRPVPAGHVGEGSLSPMRLSRNSAVPT